MPNQTSLNYNNLPSEVNLSEGRQVFLTKRFSSPTGILLQLFYNILL